MKRNEGTPVYLVVVPTGLFSADGVELVVLVTTKLTRSAADIEAAKTPGARVDKQIATKQ